MNELENFRLGGVDLPIADKVARTAIAEIEKSIPTKTSQLENDSGFITDADVPTKTSQLTNDSGFITGSDVPTKTSQLENDSNFVSESELSLVATTGMYSDLSGLPTIPSTTSQLTNDSGFITSADVPTKTSQLTNDSDFVTSSELATSSVGNSAQLEGHDASYFAKDSDFQSYALGSITRFGTQGTSRGLIEDTLNINTASAHGDENKVGYVYNGGTSNLPPGCGAGIRDVIYYNPNLIIIRVVGILNGTLKPCTWYRCCSGTGWGDWTTSFPVMDGADNNVTRICDVDHVNPYGAGNLPSCIATENASTLVDSPVTSGAFYAYREVLLCGFGLGQTHHKVIVRLTEAYPSSGRIWIRAYNPNDGWGNWKQIQGTV